MYNTPQALAATAERPAEVGMYAFAINPLLIRDMRRTNDATIVGKARRAAQHIGLRYFAGPLLGQQRAAFVADAKHGEAEGVLYNSTVQGQRQKEREDADPSVVPEELMIVRRPDTEFVRVGTYHV